MNYIIQDNFFEDPDSIRKHALSLKYYTKENHPYGMGVFPGYRTDYIDNIDRKFYDNIHNKILPHISKLENVNHPKEKYTDFNLQLSFSYTLKEANSFKHIDKVTPGYKVRYGGLVYLYPKPSKKCGTTLHLKDTIYLENKYNRFVLYKSNIEHEPTDNFGSDINNSRLVLTIFYDMA
jgi:hypothetical protein|tara:strand:- start:589 stop:1122 length:534 start_codon:yes stop_codon:yes gene_type:complete